MLIGVRTPSAGKRGSGGLFEHPTSRASATMTENRLNGMTLPLGIPLPTGYQFRVKVATLIEKKGDHDGRPKGGRKLVYAAFLPLK